jgi:hypothetical protein
MKTISIYTISILFVSFCIFFADCKKEKKNSPSSNLQDSFNNIGTYPAPASITYTAIDGSVITDSVFPGQIVILFSTNSVSSATNLINQNGGTVVAQTPTAGLYVATVNPGNINAFLTAMYRSSIVIDAFPNSALVGRGDPRKIRTFSSGGDASSIIQTIDVAADLGCGITYHKDAVGAFASVGGVSVQINDATIQTSKGHSGSDYYRTWGSYLLKLLSNAQQSNLPVIINISLGDSIDNLDNDRQMYKRFAFFLQAASKQFPNILNNAVIYIAGSDNSLNETATFADIVKNPQLHNSLVWNSLYFVESQEGTGSNGCGLGYADIGTSNVLSGPGCNLQIPGSLCPPVKGTSFATPFIANLAAQAYNSLNNANKTLSVSAIAKKLWQYYSIAGMLPTAAQLVDYCLGGSIVMPLTGTWVGTWAWAGTGANGCSFSDGGSFSVSLTQSSLGFSGTVNGDGIQTRDNSTCALQSTNGATGNINGTIAGTALNLSFNLNGGVNELDFTGTATLNNNTLTATFSRSTGGSGTFTVTKQ